MIYLQVMNRPGLAVKSPVDGLQLGEGTGDWKGQENGVHAKARSREEARDEERGGMVNNYWRLKIAKWRAG